MALSVLSDHHPNVNGQKLPLLQQPPPHHEIAQHDEADTKDDAASQQNHGCREVAELGFAWEDNPNWKGVIWFYRGDFGRFPHQFDPLFAVRTLPDR